MAKKNKAVVVEAVKTPARVINENGKWSVEKARSFISRNGGTVTGKGVFHPAPGLKVLGAMDYLINHAGFHKALA
jgi:hypothetical protein